jgi:hypothetical protein
MVAAWRKGNIQIYDQGDLSQNVIRPRKYDALLFGEVVGRELDLFAFWDSSQRNDPGLNIAMYANPPPTKCLSSCARQATTTSALSLYQQFDAELKKTSLQYFSMRPISCILYLRTYAGLTSGLSRPPATDF